MLQGHRREGVAGHVELQGLLQPRILGPPLEDDIGPLVSESFFGAIDAPRENGVGPCAPPRRRVLASLFAHSALRFSSKFIVKAGLRI